MKNCGLHDLRLVKPREEWPNEDAVSMAAGADDILKKIKVFETISEALHDVSYVFALTARNRDITKFELSPEQAALNIIRYNESNENSAFLFGPEQSGLTNDEISIANALVRVPLEKNFSSLNLSQAVLLMSWEWRKQVIKNSILEKDSIPNKVIHRTPKSTAQERDYLFLRLEHFLEEHNFFATKEMKPSVMNNIKSIFIRADLSQQEVGTLNGIISAIERKMNKS